MNNQASRTWAAWLALQGTEIEQLRRLTKVIDPRRKGGRVEGAVAWCWAFEDGSQLYVKRVGRTTNVAGGLKAEVYEPPAVEQAIGTGVQAPLDLDILWSGEDVGMTEEL